MKTKAIIAVLLAGIMVSGFTLIQTDKKPWIVPDAAKNKKNPVSSNTESIATGKNLWSTHCKSCHGTKGKGDGTKAAQLETECGDFTQASFQSQTDGSIFYKISEGRKDMPSFKKKITEEKEIWSLVNYVRTLK